MKFKYNPLTGHIDIVPDSGTYIQKLNPLTGHFNLTVENANSYKYDPVDGELHLWLEGGYSEKTVTGNGYIDVTDAVAGMIIALKAYGGTEQRNLPAGYTLLDGIAGDGNAYIDLNMQLTEDDEADVYFTKPSNLASSNVFGGRTSAGQNNISVIIAGTGNAVLDFNNSDYTDYRLNTSINLNTTYKAVLNKTGRYLYQGDTLIDSNTVANSDTITTHGTYLFHLAGSGLTSKFAGTINRVAIKGKKDLLPCKNSNNVVGMYDIINGVFYTNANETGSFTAGSEVVPTPTTPIDIVSNNGVIKARRQSGLPIGYTLLDYIQSGGSNYIDTGIKLTNEDVIEMQYLQTADKGAVYGEYNNSTVNMSTTLYGNGTFYFYAFNAGGTATSVGNYDTNVHTVVHNFVDGYIDFDGVRTTFALPDPNSFINALNCPIFGRSNGSSIGYFSKTQLYYFRIRRNGTLILDLIPAKDSSDTVGMYDRVSGTLFTESGSGSFMAGNTAADPIEVYADGTTETVSITGNLVDFNETRINSDTWNTADKTKGFEVCADVYNKTVGTAMLTNGNCFGAFVPCKLGESVSINFFDYVPGGGRCYCCEITADKKCNTTPIQYAINNGTLTQKTFTLTQPDSIGFIIEWYVTAGQTRNYTKENYTIVNGTTPPTAYIPYFNGGTATAEMLLAIGDIKDEQEILSGNITRSVGVKVLDGTEEWTKASGYTGIYYCPVSGAYYNDTSAGRIAIPCTHFTGTTATNTNMANETIKLTAQGAALTNPLIYIKTTAGSDNLDNFKARLVDQNNAGTPVIVLYPLKTPTTEIVEGQTLRLTNGNNRVEITEASIDNLGLELTYTSNN